MVLKMDHPLMLRTYNVVVHLGLLNVKYNLG